MKERIIQPKKTTTDSFSIPALRQPTRGFGSQSSGVSPAAPDNSLVHDISRIPLRRPQTKLTVNQPGDIYEQQADKMAQEVVGRLAEPGNSSSIQRQQVPQEEELQMKPLDISTLQRESAPEEEEEELQMKSLDTSTLQRESVPEEEEEELQMKSLDTSTLQRESVPEEEEEELQMKSLDISTLQRESVPEEEEEELQMKSLDTSTLQRESVPEEEEELQMKPMVQRQGGAGMAASPDLEASINQARGSGQPMADNIREPMEQAFGADFSGVKVHTDSQSDELNQSIQARAFTTGQDVFFRQGEYNPGSRGGQELLAHELTHVVQQSGGAVQRKPQPLKQQQHHQSPKTPSASLGSVVQRISVPKVQIKSAIQSLHPDWTLGTAERTIAVWEIDRVQKWDFHFSAMFDPTGVNMTKFHFTIRNGSKGDDAFAWFNVEGHNVTATAGQRENAGNIEYYNVGSEDYKKIPRKIRSQFAFIDQWANTLIAEAARFCS